MSTPLTDEAPAATSDSPERLGLPLILTLTAVVLALYLADATGLHQNDEDLYIGIARSMVARGQWLVPWYLDAVDFHKPPLLYWMMRASMALLGPSVLAARLPVALCGLALVAVVHRLARVPEQPRAAALAAGLVATSLGFFQYARTAMMDIPLTLVFATSLLGWESITQGRARGAWMVALCCSASFLLKGPVGVVLIAGTGLAWRLLWRPDEGPFSSLPQSTPWQAAGAATALMAAWPLLLAAQGQGSTWYERFIVAENLGKFTASSNSIAVMLKGFAGHLAPWTLLMATSLALTLHGLRRRTPSERLLACAALTTLGVFCLPAIKWSQYLLPALPPLAVLTARRLAGSGDVRPALPVRWAATASGLVLMALALPLLVAPRLLPGSEELWMLLAMVSGCLVGGAALFGGRLPEATVLALFVVEGALALLAPRLSVDVIPAGFAQAVGSRRVVVFEAPPHRYANALGRPVDAATEAGEVRQAFEQGALLVVGSTELAELMRAHAIDSAQTTLVLCWKRWRRHLAPADVQRGLEAGSPAPLLEDMCLIERLSDTPAAPNGP